jgi:transcription initiation factor TFIIIB Brf1 subunit/transcription initiation factor TFIIB
MDLVTNCPLCETRSLQIVNQPEDKLLQCLHCGYVSVNKFIGTIEDNIEFEKLPEDMKKMAKQGDGRIWIPSVMTLPNGVVNPVLVDDNMFWAFSPMIEIPEEEREKYPDDKGGFYKNRYDNESTRLYQDFSSVMKKVTSDIEKKNPQEKSLKLPKLKKL